jgi:acylphosphatase
MEASRLGVSGTVRNLSDGQVEVLAEGGRDQVEALVAWCRRGPPSARVEALEVTWEPPTGEAGPFSVVR